jgi:hypothetical protein
MKSHATAATLVGAALFLAAAAAAQTSTTSGRAMKGMLIEATETVLGLPIITDETEQERGYPVTPSAMVACGAVAMATPAEAQPSSVNPPTGIAVEAKPIATFSARAPDQRRLGWWNLLPARILPIGSSGDFQQSALHLTESILFPSLIRDSGSPAASSMNEVTRSALPRLRWRRCSAPMAAR